MFGVEPVGHPYPKRLVLPDGWPTAPSAAQGHGLEPRPKEYDENREFKFGETPPGCTVVPSAPSIRPLTSPPTSALR